MSSRILTVALLLPVAALTACGQSRDPQPAAQSAASQPAPSQPKTALGRQVERAMREARRELATQNISLNNGIRFGPDHEKASQDHLPKAEITPGGDLLIEGKPVPVDAAQRAQLLKYRGHVVAVAEAGMAIGVQGADLGMQAAGEAIKGIFSGDTDNIERRIEAEAEKIEVEAAKLCAQLPPMLATEQALAASLPAFKPYARMDEQDVNDCSQKKDPHAVRDTVRSEIRENIRGGIRDTVRSVVRTEPAGADKAAEATAATLIAAVETQRIEEVRRQVKAGADINARVRGDGTALIRAAAGGNLATVNELIRLGADVNKSSRGDGNPLIAAAKAGHLDIVKRLVAAGADIDPVVPGDETALINAARSGHLDVVTYLVEHGADVNQGVFADYGRWRSPLNQATDAGVRKYLQGKGARAGRDA